LPSDNFFFRTGTYRPRPFFFIFLAAEGKYGALEKTVDRTR
jgi:hypothetical protein